MHLFNCNVEGMWVKRKRFNTGFRQNDQKEAERTNTSWPLTKEELLKKLDSGVLPELYNAIYYSIHDWGKINEFGYCGSSYNLATKIWSMASDWKVLVTGDESPKQIILALVLHRLTASKEGINMLHKSNHVISYNDVRVQNKLEWCLTIRFISPISLTE